MNNDATRAAATILPPAFRTSAVALAPARPFFIDDATWAPSASNLNANDATVRPPCRAN
jgi:hypothetical protein